MIHPFFFFVLFLFFFHFIQHISFQEVMVLDLLSRLSCPAHSNWWRSNSEFIIGNEVIPVIITPIFVLRVIATQCNYSFCDRLVWDTDVLDSTVMHIQLNLKYERDTPHWQILSTKHHITSYSFWGFPRSVSMSKESRYDVCDDAPNFFCKK